MVAKVLVMFDITENKYVANSTNVQYHAENLKAWE